MMRHITSWMMLDTDQMLTPLPSSFGKQTVGRKLQFLLPLQTPEHSVQQSRPTKRGLVKKVNEIPTGFSSFNSNFICMDKCHQKLSKHLMKKELLLGEGKLNKRRENKIGSLVLDIHIYIFLFSTLML